MKRRSTNGEEESPSRGRRRRNRATLRKHQDIEHVTIEDVFALKEPSSKEPGKAGEAAYVHTTINNKRFYGILVEASALKQASRLHFQDTAAEIELNRRMRLMLQTHSDQHSDLKEGNAPEANSEENESAAETSQGRSVTKTMTDVGRQVQKFRFVQGDKQETDYRLLLATFANVEAAADENPEKQQAIADACNTGGNFVGKYYYQYESVVSTLKIEETRPNTKGLGGLRMTMGFDNFLKNTALPPWYPLSASRDVAQQEVLGTLGMKKEGRKLVWDDALRPEIAPMSKQFPSEALIPTDARACYRVSVVGGGIAGLSCCLELFQLCEREGIDVEITLIEGRSRLGGRLWTDRSTFSADGTSEKNFPVDLGASWIHGIESNPLAALAHEAKVDFVTTSEDVTMLCEGGNLVDQSKDDRAGELFDKLLDLAVQQCWRGEESLNDSGPGRESVRWYSSKLDSDADGKEGIPTVEPQKEALGSHRDCADISVDEAIGKAVSSGVLGEIASISEDERRVLQWCIRNVEYALGANIADLSMKYWDIDERHAFEGAHVILRQGYSCVVEHLQRKLEERGSRFKCMMKSPVKCIHYSQKAQFIPYFCPSQRLKRFVEISDTCKVDCEDGTSVACDFVVCAVPLGVLKEAIKPKKDDSESNLRFEPELPFSKRDAIQSVGFGLLDKVYIQFPVAFWRHRGVFNKEGQSLFGNCSATNPHQYMFLDVGLSLGANGTYPPILMTLVSGKDAVESECRSEEDLAEDVMKTLRVLFGDDIPKPSSFRATRWGRDKYARGSYTYLAPGTTDEDFRLLQSPINSNGDLILLEGSETMRVFFAGEHTTALHPSMAHGAMLSGYRAAKEILDAMTVKPADILTDRVIPLSLFRHMNPKAKLMCSLCHLTGARVREGSLLAFKRGSREVVVHVNCAENCPEVSMSDGVWTNVIKAVNRGKTVECALCGQVGATIGCAVEGCTKSHHFSCAEDTGWRFEDDGKDFVCDEHRLPIQQTRKISLEYWMLKCESGISLGCAFCGETNNRDAGELVAFQEGVSRIVVHECCARQTNIGGLRERSSSRFENDFENIFQAVDAARSCTRCLKAGASIECSVPSCRECVHYHCACSLDWDFSKNKNYRCISHRSSSSPRNNGQKVPKKEAESTFQHALFAQFGAESADQDEDDDAPANMETNDSHPYQEELDDFVTHPVKKRHKEVDYFRTEKLSEYSDGVDVRLVNVLRNSPEDKWGLTLEAAVDEKSGARYLTVQGATSDHDGLFPGDVVCSMNGEKVGSSALDTIQKCLKILAQEVDVLMEVCTGAIGTDDAWG